MKRNTVLIVAVAAVALLFLLNPLRLFQNRRGPGQPPRVDAKVLEPLVSSASASARSPEDYLLSCFAQHDIVFLGEFAKISQDVRLVSSLIPRLDAAGVRNLGIEYALSDSQAEIDALLALPAWDEERARSVFIDWVPTWGYQEYVDVLRAAWEVNRGRAPGAARFRVVGLNVRQNWDLLRTERDARDPATVRRILAGGVPDAHMAGVILREFVDRGEKALVFCGTQHAFTRFRSREYERSAAEMKLPETRRAGSIVFDRIGDRAFTVLLHSPWPDGRSRTGLDWAAGGVIDALIARLPGEKRRAGWDTAGTDLGAVPIPSGSYRTGYASLVLADLCGGYVVQGPLADYRAVTPIPDFVPADRADDAVRNFPGVKPARLTLADVNRAIIDDARAVDEMLAGFGSRR